MKYYILLLIMTLLGAFGSYHLKKASGRDDAIQIISSPSFFVGGALYLLSAFFNIYVLGFLDYSVVLPLTSITYIWTLLISWKFLGEKMSGKKLFGVLIIMAGAGIIAGG